MVKCEICKKDIVALHEHDFPEDILREKTCCACIPWRSMDKCIGLSLDNAHRLVEDAEYLIKAGKLDSARVLTVFSFEESGRALLAYDYLVLRENVSQMIFRERFLNHQAKIDRALEAIEKVYPQHGVMVRALWGDFASELHRQKLESLFVNYDGHVQLWVPQSLSYPETLAKAHDVDVKDAKDMREAQRLIAEEFIKRLIETAKAVISLVQEAQSIVSGRGSQS